MIFGYKQQGTLSTENYNKFPNASYSESFQQMAKTEKNLQGIIDEAYFFGQIPTMLFKKPHEKRDKKDKKDSVCKEIITKGNSFTSARSMSLTKKGKVHALLLCGKVVIVIKSEDNKYFMIKIKANKFIEEFVLKNFCLVEPMHWPGSFY